MGNLWDSYAVSKFAGRRVAVSSDTENFDAIIIGSGFGGSVMAARLAEKGQSVCVLERGHRWKPENYPRKPDDAWWWSDDSPAEHNGWIDLKLFDDMGVAAGCGVGGGSLIYANIFIPAQPFVFEEGWPEQITYETLQPYYEKASAMMSVHELPDNQLTERAKLMKEAAEKAGYGDRYRKLPLAVTFSEDWNYDLDDPFNECHSKTFINAQGMEQGTCIHCGNCDIGCTVKAKNTLDLNYIPLAEKYGAQVRALHLVNRITLQPNGSYKVNFDRIDAKSKTLTAGAVIGKQVFIAAGSLGSTELLLRCKEQHGTLPDVSDRLGYGWCSNGDFLTPAIYNDRNIEPTRGPTISSAIDFLDGSMGGHRFFVEDGGFPDVLGNAIGGINKGVNKYGLLAAAINQAVRDRNPLSCVMPWFGQAVDYTDGRLHLSRSWIPPFNKKLDLDWDVTRSEPVVQAMVDMHKTLSEITGGKPLVPPTWTISKDLITPHPLGGCCMGNSAEDGVVDHKGEVFGYPGLFVVDGATIPRAVGLNPSCTIAALAERAADIITQGMKNTVQVSVKEEVNEPA